jgi:hypothetical protein
MPVKLDEHVPDPDPEPEPDPDPDPMPFVHNPPTQA